MLFVLKMEAETWKKRIKGVCVVVVVGVVWRKIRGGGQAGRQDSDIHALRRGDTDKVSSLLLGQAVIAVSPRFQVATPQRHRHYWVAAWCHNPGPSVGRHCHCPTVKRGFEILNTHTHTEARWSALATSLATICPALPCSGLGQSSQWACLDTSEVMGQNGGTQEDKGLANERV